MDPVDLAVAPGADLQRALGNVVSAIAAGSPAPPGVHYALVTALSGVREAALALESARALGVVAGDETADDVHGAVGELDAALQLAGGLLADVALDLGRAADRADGLPVRRALLDCLDETQDLVGEVDNARALARALRRALDRAPSHGSTRSRAPAFARELGHALDRAATLDVTRADGLLAAVG